MGSNRLIPVDVRTIAATSRKLQQEGGRKAASGRPVLSSQRHDPLQVPLRERLEDLAYHRRVLADSVARRLGEPPRKA